MKHLTNAVDLNEPYDFTNDGYQLEVTVDGEVIKLEIDVFEVTEGDIFWQDDTYVDYKVRTEHNEYETLGGFVRAKILKNTHRWEKEFFSLKIESTSR